MHKSKFLFFLVSFIILSVKGFSETYTTSQESNYERLSKKKLNLQEFDWDTLKRDIYKGREETTRIGYKEFASIIKAKYPQYSDVDDMVLAKKMIEKYPVYGEKVIFFDKNKIDYELFDKEAVEKYPQEEPQENKGKTIQQELDELRKLYSNHKSQQPDYSPSDKEEFEERQVPDWLNDYKEKFGEIQKSNEQKNKKDNSEKIETEQEPDNKSIEQQKAKIRALLRGHKPKENKESEVDYGPFDNEAVEKKQYPDWLFEGLPEEVKNIFQIDKIKIGDTEIEIPIPCEFVKIDEGFKEELEIANSFVPKINTLLSFYLSEKDFGDLLTDGFHQSDKYIMIQVFNELKYKKIGLKDYQKFLKSYKKDFFKQFGQQFQENALETVQDISKSLDVDIDFEKIGMYPLGIYYESKNSLSTGVLSKINYLYSGTTSHENIVAVSYTHLTLPTKRIV